MTFPKLNVLGVGISRLDYASAVARIISRAKSSTPLAVTALAVHGVMEGYYNADFKEILNGFDMVTPDGQPVKWALNLLGAREIRERVCGPVLMEKVCEAAAAEGIPIFFYGSTRAVLAGLKENLLERYPRIVITGMKNDRFRPAAPEEDREDIDAIKTSQARIVFVGTGCPRQERWIDRHRGSVNAVMIAVGAAFDFHAGILKRPPKFIQDIGFEWLYRLSQEPKRLWRRYLLLNPVFLFNFLLQLFKIKKF